MRGYIQPNGWTTNNWAAQCVFPDSNATDSHLAARIENNVSGSWLVVALDNFLEDFQSLSGWIDSITFDIRIDDVLIYLQICKCWNSFLWQWNRSC